MQCNEEEQTVHYCQIEEIVWKILCENEGLNILNIPRHIADEDYESRLLRYNS